MHIVSWRKVLIPTALEALVYGSLAVAILIAANAGSLFDYFTKDIPIDNSQLQQSLSDQLSGIASNKFASIATIVLFWSFIGLGVYIVFWLVLNFITGLKNEVVIETDYVNKSSFFTRVSLPLTRFVLASGVLGWLMLSLKFLFPLWIGLSNQFWANLNTIDLQTILTLFVSVLGASITIYMLASLVKFIFALRD